MGTTTSARSDRMRSGRYHAIRQARRRRLRQRFAGGVLLTVILAVAVVLVIRSRSSDAVPAFELVHEAYAGIPISGRALGDSAAPVTVVEYGDYQCPGCGYFARELEGQLVRDYVETGKVHFEFRDYAFIGNESKAAAEAAACAADQDVFWQFHATLYRSQMGENMGGFGQKRMKAMASGLGMDGDRFAKCVNQQSHADDVDRMRAEARTKGVTGTPSFVVNGVLIEYAGYESLRVAIDAALEAKS
ncbi:MAG: DsbA family protein [Thermomicrobiales bacterium]